MKLLYITTLFFLLFSSCKKDNDGSSPEEEYYGHSTEPVVKSQLILGYEFIKNGIYLSYDSIYTDANNNHYKINTFTIILNLKFNCNIQDNNYKSTLRLNNPVFSTRIINSTTDYNSVGGVNLSVGFDAITDITFPSQELSDLQYFNSNEYIYIYMSGDVDTNGDGVFDDIFDYKIGTSQFLFSHQYSFTDKDLSNDIPTINLSINMDELLDQINFVNNRIVNSTTESVISQQIINNLSKSITVN